MQLQTPSFDVLMNSLPKAEEAGNTKWREKLWILMAT